MRRRQRPTRGVSTVCKPAPQPPFLAKRQQTTSECLLFPASIHQTRPAFPHTCACSGVSSSFFHTRSAMTSPAGSTSNAASQLRLPSS